MASRQDRDFYDEARLLIRNVKAASLATSEGGVPHAALVTLAFLEFQPILLLSRLAVHTRQLDANPACALLLIGEARAGVPASPNPQTTPRLCLTGTAARTENPLARTVFLESHPYARLYADFADFAFWQVFVTKSYYIGGFGAARRLDVARLAAVP